jgi:hypothetical protein
MKLTIELSIDEINAILQLLGQAPTSSGVWPLLVNIKEQAEKQIKTRDEQ